jgi:hypothetical protein
MATYLEAKEKELLVSLEAFRAQWESLPAVIEELKEEQKKAEATLQAVVETYADIIDRTCRYRAKLEDAGRLVHKYMEEFHAKERKH